MGGLFYRFRMKSKFIHKTFEEQIDLLESRSMLFSNKKSKEKAAHSLSIISYYRIKEFAKPFAVTKKINNKRIIDYQNTKFEIVISRYYQDKNLRLHLLHAIEDIEVALKTRVAYILGKNGLGSYGYLDFSKWCNKEEYCKHYLLYRQNDFKKKLLSTINNSESFEIKEKQKIDKTKFPPVWLMVNSLTFGQVVALLELMSVKNLTKISQQFSCSNSELLSWLRCINLVRNICAHNSNIIDLKLTTTPSIKKEWKNFLFEYKSGVYSNRIALPFLIILEMMDQINPKYQFKEIIGSLDKLIRDEATANYYGFKALNTLEKIKQDKKIKK